MMQTSDRTAPSPADDRGPGSLGPPRGLLLATGALVAAFGLPLYHLVRLALGDELYSHVVLIPCISGYLVRAMRKTLPRPSPPARGLAVALGLAGAALAVWRGVLAASGAATPPEDSLALTISSFLLFFGGLCAWFLGRDTLRACRFPLLFLVFMVPFPVGLRTALETLLQYGSAWAAHGFFWLSGMPVFRRDLTFALPGFNLEVAPQCSGIHSSLALLITSVLAAHLFLRTPWKQATLAGAVIPLALLRNGLRVCVIGTLCVRIGPEMIDSYIHRHGGPIFFALSLIPLILLLWLLVRSDRRGAGPRVPSS